MLFKSAIYDIQFSAWRGPSSSDDPDSLSFGIENLQANHLIMVVFTRWQRIKIPFRDIEDRTDPWFGVINPIHAG